MKLVVAVFAVAAMLTLLGMQDSKPASRPAAAAPDAVAQVKAAIDVAVQAGKIDKSKPTWRTTLPKFPTVTFPAGQDYFWHLKTNLGEIKVRYLPDVAPQHVASSIYLTELGFFDGLKFHRVITGFMAQGGCPQGNGRGNPGYSFAGEYSPSVKHDRPGLLSMANAGPGTDGSQFFLTFKPTPHLDGKHTIFGEIVDGMPVMKEFEERGSASGTPTAELLIEKAWITSSPAAAKKE